MAKKTVNQTYFNHRQLYPLHHMVLTPLSLVTLGVATTSLVQAAQAGAGLTAPLLLFLLALMMVLTIYAARRHALIAQDRGIRTEENLRHFILTGKPLDNRLTLSQIIALRFASDHEFPSLAARAAETGMRPREIKLAIQSWRPDLYRV